MQIFDFLMQEGNSDSPIMGLVAQQVATKASISSCLIRASIKCCFQGDLSAHHSDDVSM